MVPAGGGRRKAWVWITTPDGRTTPSAHHLPSPTSPFPTFSPPDIAHFHRQRHSLPPYPRAFVMRTFVLPARISICAAYGTFFRRATLYRAFPSTAYLPPFTLSLPPFVSSRHDVAHAAAAARSRCYGGHCSAATGRGMANKNARACDGRGNGGAERAGVANTT